MGEKDILEEHNRMYVDFYIGEGKNDPPMTVRMDRLEKAQENYQHYARLILGTLLVLVIGVIFNIVAKH